MQDSFIRGVGVHWGFTTIENMMKFNNKSEENSLKQVINQNEGLVMNSFVGAQKKVKHKSARMKNIDSILLMM